MSNTYFQFKQFTIHQDRCAMKVCTDACILGAWFSEKIPAGSQVLDIGSGTGLLMLMLAQRNGGAISGIELDRDAFEQLKENIGLSPWKERLPVLQGDIRSFVFPEPFDFIISNPPFYEGDLPADSGPKNLARHSQELTLVELLEAIERDLKAEGSFGILLPYHRLVDFETLAMTRQFYLQEKLLVRQTPRHAPFRGILHFSRRKERSAPVSELLIKDGSGEDTKEFAALLKEYYLKL